MVIDDNRDSADSACDVLRLLGNRVECAYDGRAGVAMAARFKPHMILLDLAMPGMDGYALAPALRRLAGTRRMVLAAVTGYGQAADRERALTAGFDHYLVKPLEADILLRFIDAQAEST